MNRPSVMTSSRPPPRRWRPVQERQQVDRQPGRIVGLGGEARGGDGRLDRLELIEQEVLPERDQVEPQSRQTHLLDRVLELLRL